MSDVIFANLYIERLLFEIAEQTKARMLNETRLTYLEKINADLSDRINKLEESKTAELDKRTKKTQSNTF
jgi:hypothetical protein